MPLLAFHRPVAGDERVVSRTEERAAENESIFRDANERIEQRLGARRSYASARTRLVERWCV
jgi:hypothetical protein